MIPRTIHGLDPFECLSAIQKFIRRGMEREAMEFAVELIHTSKNFTTMVCNRLEVISHEDIDCVNQPHIIPFVYTAMTQAKDAWNTNPMKLGRVRMYVGNTIRLLSRSAKSREGDHFQGAVGLQNLLNGYVPEVPDWVLDKHSIRGRKMGRGIEYFRSESAKLHPEPLPDIYEDECYEMWKLRDAGARPKSDSKENYDLFE